ncbi:MAG: hypothetical protein AB1782_20625 [Cyanobacteriota bacterium]
MRTIKGQNLLEFSIILALVVIVAVLTLTFLGDEINELFSGSKSEYSKFKPFDWNTKKPIILLKM